MATCDDLRQAAKAFGKTPDGFALDLRISLVPIILQQLNRRKWSQRKLASRTGLSEVYISNILHSKANCSLDTVGKILHAIGVRAVFCDRDELDWLRSRVATSNVDATADYAATNCGELMRRLSE